MADEKTSITIYISKERKKEIENCFLDNRIKNYQEGYKEVLDEGFEKFKKIREKKNVGSAKT